MGQLLVESEATHVRTITKPELIPGPDKMARILS